MILFGVFPAIVFQEESKLQKKKAAALKTELQETSDALVALLESVRK